MLRSSLIALLLAIATVSFNLAAEDDHDLVGTWEGKSVSGKVVEMEFKKDGTVVMKKDGQSPPPELKMVLTWKVDDEKTPHHLNLSMTMTAGGQEQKQDINMLYQFPTKDDDDTVIIVGPKEKTDPSVRPAAMDGGDAITFKRKEK